MEATIGFVGMKQSLGWDAARGMVISVSRLSVSTKTKEREPQSSRHN